MLVASGIDCPPTIITKLHGYKTRHKLEYVLIFIKQIIRCYTIMLCIRFEF